MITFLLQIIAVVFGLGFLVFIHELGHFSVAKFYKVKVLKFTLGFGKEIWGFTKGETRYSVCLFPLGGMVAMAGENPDEAKGEKDEFLSLPFYKKIMIIFAGPLMNYVFAIFLFAFIFNLWGTSAISDEAKIGALAKDSCAQKAGLLINDKILSIDGENIENWLSLTDSLKGKAEKEVNLKILIDDK